MKSILPFLRELSNNNNKTWFDTNRPQYEQAKQELLELIQEVITQCSLFDESLSSIQPKDSIFRINRDVRFSHDKSPYKSNMAFELSAHGKKAKNASYYVHIQPDQSFIAGGIYGPEKDVLQAIRQEIDYNFSDFDRIIKNTTFQKNFGGLSEEGRLNRAPKGYSEDNQAINYLKNRNFIAIKKLKEEIFLNEKLLIREISEAFESLYPFITFLNTSLINVNK